VNEEALAHWGAGGGAVAPKTHKERRKQTNVALMKVSFPGFNAVSLGGQFPTFLLVVSKDP